MNGELLPSHSLEFNELRLTDVSWSHWILFRAVCDIFIYSVIFHSKFEKGSSKSGFLSMIIDLCIKFGKTT
jgi:hypothetical protein